MAATAVLVLRNQVHSRTAERGIDVGLTGGNHADATAADLCRADGCAASNGRVSLRQRCAHAGQPGAE